MENTKKKNGNKILVAIIAVLLISSTFAVFSSQTQTPTVSASGTGPQSTQINPATGLPYGDVMQYEWGQWKANGHWDSYSPGPAPNSGDLLWMINATGAASGRYYPAAFNGKVYIYSGNQMRAYDGLTGALVWNQTYASGGAPVKIDNTHAVAGQTCFNPDTGALIWRATPVPSPLTPNINYTFATSPDFRAMGSYSEEAKMYVKAGLGWNFSNPDQPPKLQWDISNTLFGNWDFESSGKDNTGRVVALYRGDTVIYGIDIATGKVIWTSQTSGGYNAYQGNYYDGAFYKGLIDGNFWAINATNGAIMWKYPHDVWYTNFGCGSCAAYGMVYSLRTDGYLFAFDAKTGEVVWKYLADWMYYWGGPQVADGKIYVSAPDGGGGDPYTGRASDQEYVCIDAFTGKLLWKIFDLRPGASGAEPTMIAYGNVYIPEGGRLRCYGEAKSDWPMFRRDPLLMAHGASGPTSMSLRWSFPTGGQVIGSPSIVNDRVYIGSYDKNLYCLNYSTGAKIWNFTTGTYIGWSPAVVGGKVYTGADDGKVYCLDAITGSLVWTKPLTVYAPANLSARFSYATPSPIVQGNKLWIGGVDGFEYCLDIANSGNVLWSFDTAPGAKTAFVTNLKSSGAVMPDDTVWVVGSPTSTAQKYPIYHLSATGQILLQFRMPYTSLPPIVDTIFAAPCVVGDRLLIPDQDTRYYCFNTTNGAQIWNYTFTETSQLTSCSTYYDGKFIIADGFETTALNATNGARIWSTFLKREVYNSPTVADYGDSWVQNDKNNAKVYIGENEGFVFCLNATSGTRDSWYSTESFVDSSVSLYKGWAFVGSRDFNLYCFEEANPTALLTPKISVKSSATQVSAGGPVTVSGTMFPAVPNLALTVHFSRPDGSHVDKQVAYAGVTGAFSVTYTPDTSGQWAITVASDYNRDANVLPSISNAVPLSVSGAQPTSTPTATPTQTPANTQTATPTETAAPTSTIPATTQPTQTAVPTETVAPTSTPAPQSDMTAVYVVVVVVVIIIIAAAAYMVAKRRKK